MTPQQQSDKRKRVSQSTIIPYPASNAGVAGAINVTLKLQNERAEEAVIGSVLQKADHYHSVAEMLQPGDFSILFNGYCWWAFEELTKANEPIDLMTVADKLEEKGYEDATLRLSKLIKTVPDAANIEAYARMVRSAAMYIRIADAGRQIVDLVMDEKNRGFDEQVVDKCNQLLFEATEQRAHESTSILAAINAYSDRVEAALGAEDYRVARSVPTGFRGLDTHLKGFAPGELTVLAGADGMGKTSFALSIVRNIVNAGGRVVYFTLEMSTEEITRLLVAMEAGIPKDILRNPVRMSKEQYEAFVAASGNIGQWGLHIIDKHKTLTPLQFRRELRSLLVKEGIDLAVIDGLWLMEPTTQMPKRNEAVNAIVRDIIATLKECDRPGLLLHQYSSDVKPTGRKIRPPTEYDLAESAGVRRNAQVILGMHRESHYKRNGDRTTEIIIFKDRNGTATKGTVAEFVYNRRYARFEEDERIQL
jgi:replicative DNA helicase